MIKFLTLLSILFIQMSDAYISSSIMHNNITGKWSQLYSNRFVQETQEIDWYCIEIDTVLKNYHELAISKHSILHGNSYLPHNYEYTIFLPPIYERDKKLHFKSDDINIINNNKYQVEYQIIDIGPHYDYLIWTRNDNASLYIWTRNSSDFKKTYLNNVMEIIKKYDYNDYYKTPIQIPCP